MLSKMTTQVSAKYHQHSCEKNKKVPNDCLTLMLMVAGAGFEPYDLRVMSPMSYQTALPRDKALACASVLMLVYDTSYMAVCQGFFAKQMQVFAQKLHFFVKIVMFCPGGEAFLLAMRSKRHKQVF